MDDIDRYIAMFCKLSAHNISATVYYDDEKRVKRHYGHDAQDIPSDEFYSIMNAIGARTERRVFTPDQRLYQAEAAFVAGFTHHREVLVCKQVMIDDLHGQLRSILASREGISISLNKLKARAFGDTFDVASSETGVIIGVAVYLHGRKGESSPAHLILESINKFSANSKKHKSEYTLNIDRGFERQGQLARVKGYSMRCTTQRASNRGIGPFTVPEAKLSQANKTKNSTIVIKEVRNRTAEQEKVYTTFVCRVLFSMRKSR